MVDPTRARKLAVRIREIAATMIEGQIKDPRLGMVTITDVRVTGDLHDATIFYTVYGDDQQREDSGIALASATGIVRSAVGKATGLKFTPSITFMLDALPDNAHHIDDLVAVARAADEEVAKVRQGAHYAGDPDPYKAPRESSDDALESSLEGGE